MNVCVCARSPLCLAVAQQAEVLCDQPAVGLHRAAAAVAVVAVLGAAGGAAAAEERVVVHTGPPQVLAGLGAAQNQRHLTVLGLTLQYTVTRLLT